MFNLEEVVTIERGGWRSVETNNGGECVMICEIKLIQVLSCRQLGFSEEGGSRYSQYQYNTMQAWYFMSTAL